MSDVIRYHFLSNAGDICASLASIKATTERYNKKAVIFHRTGVKAHYYQGAIHPIVDEKNEQVTLNQKQFDMLYPLIKAQPYIEDYQVYRGQKFDVDIEKIRGECNVNIPYLMIQSWPMYCYADMNADLTKKWLFVEDKKEYDFFTLQKDNLEFSVPAIEISDYVIVNRTERYNNPVMDYYWLKDYEERLIFSGLPHEHELFCKQWGLDIPLLIVKDFYELAQAIKMCKFLLAGQSLSWNIAEGMKTPRILEICAFATNCQPFIGEKSYGFYYKKNCEYYFDLLLNESSPQ